MLFKVLVLALVIEATFGARHLLTPESEAWYKKIHDSCVESTGVDEKDVQAAENGAFPEDNQKLKEFFVCLFNYEGIITPEGTVNGARFVERIPDEIKHIFEMPVRECHDLLHGNIHDTVLKIAECIHRKETEQFFIP